MHNGHLRSSNLPRELSGYGKILLLTKILKPGDIIKVSIKNIHGKSVQLELEQDPQVEGALVAIDQDTGFIRAMIGGYDFIKSDFNRAIYAKRQAGVCL